MHKGYYINLDRMTSRREFIETQLSHLGLHELFSRWPGVDASTLQMQSIEHYVPSSKQRTLQHSTRWELSGVEVAIFESHRRIWKEIVDEDMPYAIILEDDLKLSMSIQNLMEKVEDISGAVDVLKLDGVRRRCRFGPPLSGTQLEVRPIVKQRVHSTGAYLVSRTGAGKLLNWSEPYSDQADAFVFYPRAGYRLFQLFPAVALQGALMRNLESGRSRFRSDNSCPGLWS